MTVVSQWLNGSDSGTCSVTAQQASQMVLQSLSILLLVSLSLAGCSLFSSAVTVAAAAVSSLSPLLPE